MVVEGTIRGRTSLASQVSGLFEGLETMVSPALDGGMRITTRSGRHITAEITGHNERVEAGYEVVVDAELVAGDASARSWPVTPPLGRGR